MNAAAEAETAWRSFMTDPIGYIDPERLRRSLGEGVPAGLSDRLRGCERLRSRLSALLLTSEALPDAVEPGAVAPEDAGIALAAPDMLAALTLRAGAIFWSASIANAVLGRHVAALQTALGEELCRFAVKHRELSGPEKPLEPFEDLRERVIADGWRCYASWCEAQPPAVGARARLKMPLGQDDGQPATPPYSTSGPAILRRAAA